MQQKIVFYIIVNGKERLFNVNCQV